MRRVLAHREWAELCSGIEASWRTAKGRHELHPFQHLTDEPPSYEVWPAKEWLRRHPEGSEEDDRPKHERVADWEHLKDKATDLAHHVVDNESEHILSPFKAITNFDHYVEPTIHHWDPATADDIDPTSSYEDVLQHYNMYGWTPEERAKAKRKQEMANTGRDVGDFIERMFARGASHQAKFVGYDDDEAEGDLPAPSPAAQRRDQTHGLGWEARGMDDSQLGGATFRYHADAQWNNDAMRATTHQEHPGLTMHDIPGDEPHSGFMVSEPGSEEHESFSRLVPHDIGDYYDRHQNQIHGHPDTYYGGWEDNGEYYQDVSDNVKDPWQAAQRGEKDHQLAIYDLNQGKGIPTDEAEEQLFYHGQPGYYMAHKKGWL